VKSSRQVFYPVKPLASASECPRRPELDDGHRLSYLVTHNRGCRGGGNASDQLDDPNLSIRVGIDVPLRGSKVCVSGQHQDVAQRSAHRRDLTKLELYARAAQLGDSDAARALQVEQEQQQRAVQFEQQRRAMEMFQGILRGVVR
jgi:hypothetical protein